MLKDMRYGAPADELVSILRRTKPVRVYLHNPADKHDTHLAVFVRALEALRSLSAQERPEKVYGMEVWRALDWLMPEDKVLFDCSEHIGLAEEILRAFDSQVAGGKQYDRAAVGRWYANATFLESHETDGAPAVSYGIDLTPLLDGGDPALFWTRTCAQPDRSARACARCRRADGRAALRPPARACVFAADSGHWPG